MWRSEQKPPRMFEIVAIYRFLLDCSATGSVPMNLRCSEKS